MRRDRQVFADRALAETYCVLDLNLITFFNIYNLNTSLRIFCFAAPAKSFSQYGNMYDAACPVSLVITGLNYDQ